MRLRELLAFVSFTAAGVCASAQTIHGTILIKKRLTKPNVTASVPVYQRGVAVKLGKDTEADPIAYELSRVVVYLEGPIPTDQGAVPALAEQIQQIDRRFMPDMVVVPVGSTVSFPNMDPIFHNIYSLSKPKTFDLGSYDKGQMRKVTFNKPGIVEIYCHLHPNMQATVVVTPSRWYARPDRNGGYTISNVPPGQYTLVAWHRSAGFFRKTVNVGSNRDAVSDFFIPLDVDAAQETAKDHDQGHDAGSR